MFHKRNSGFSATSGHISFPTRALKPVALGLRTPWDVSSEVVKPGLLGVGILRQGKYKEAWGGPRASSRGCWAGVARLRHASWLLGSWSQESQDYWMQNSSPAVVWVEQRPDTRYTRRTLSSFIPGETTCLAPYITGAQVLGSWQ